MRRFVLLAVVTAWAMVGTGALWAGTNVWTRLGPDGSIGSALAIDPLNSGTVYAATSAGLFKSTDEGANWSAVNPGPPCCILTLVINPQNPSTIYAVARATGLSLDRRVLKSTDGGANWSSVNSGFPIDAEGLYSVTSLAIDPQDPSTLYAGNALMGGGVFKTTNGGESWNAVNSGLPDGAVMVLAIDSQNPDTLYANTKGGLFKSTDGAASWSAANCGPDCFISALAIDPQNPNIVYAAGPAPSDGLVGGLFKSTDAGASWTSVRFFSFYCEGCGDGMLVIALAIDPRNSGTVYAGTSAGVFKSTDGGTSWTAAKTRPTTDTTGPLIISAMEINPQNPDTLYAAGIYAGVFKTTDAGASWTLVNSELRATTPKGVTALRIDPQTSGTIYAGTNAGVFKTTDAGANWTGVNSGLPSDAFGRLTISILEISAQNPSTLYAVGGCYQDICKSTDGSANWTPALARDASGLVTRGARLWADALAIDPRNPRTIYVSGSLSQAGSPTNLSGVLKSTDGGASWSAANSGLPTSTRNVNVGGTTLTVDPLNSDTLYVGTQVLEVLASGYGVFKTTNGGGSWKNAGLTGFSRVDILAIDPQNPNTLYARAVLRSGLGSSWLFKTTNGGASWIELDSGLPSYVTALAIDPHNPSTVYAGSRSGVFRSTDGGANWDAVNSGLTTLSVTTLAIDSQNPSTVYAGTAGGVFAITLVP